MAALIDRAKRERSKELKKERMEAIRKAGLRAFMSFPYVDVTLDSVRKLAGVPQGKPEIYFGSREALFLEIFAAEADRWFADLDARVVAARPGLDRDGLAELVAASLEPRPEMLRLLGLLQVVLEQNIDVVPGALFLRKLKGLMDASAARLEAACPWLGGGEGFSFLKRLLNYGACLYWVGRPTGAFAMMVDDQELSSLRVELGCELRYIARRLLPGG